MKYLDPVYVHLTKENFVQSQFAKDNMGQYTNQKIRNNYALAAKKLETNVLKPFENIDKATRDSILNEYHQIYINKQADSLFKEIEEMLDKTVNSFTYGDGTKLTGKKQTKGRVLDDISGYLNALNSLINTYNKIDVALMTYLAHDDRMVNFGPIPQNGLFSLTKDSTGRGAKALQQLLEFRDTIASSTKTSLKGNKDITKVIRNNVPGWLNIIKGDIEEGIDTIVGETMFNFQKDLSSEIRGVGSITGQDRIKIETNSRAYKYISTLGPQKEYARYNVAYTGFTSKSDSVMSFYSPDGKEMGLVGNSIKSFRMHNGKNVTLGGTTVLNATALTDLIETPFDYLYLNEILHNRSNMMGADGSKHILNRYLASKMATFILAGYTNGTNVPPMFLTYLNKIIYLPNLLKSAAKNEKDELFISLSKPKQEIKNEPVNEKGKTAFQNARSRSYEMVKMLRAIKINGGFNGKSVTF